MCKVCPYYRAGYDTWFKKVNTPGKKVSIVESMTIANASITQLPNKLDFHIAALEAWLQENPGSASTGSHRRSTIGYAVNAVDVNGDEIVPPLMMNYGANANLTAKIRYTRILSLFRVVSQGGHTRI